MRYLTVLTCSSAFLHIPRFSTSNSYNQLTLGTGTHVERPVLDYKLHREAIIRAVENGSVPDILEFISLLCSENIEDKMLKTIIQDACMVALSTKNMHVYSLLRAIPWIQPRYHLSSCLIYAIRNKLSALATSCLENQIFWTEDANLHLRVLITALEESDMVVFTSLLNKLRRNVKILKETLFHAARMGHVAAAHILLTKLFFSNDMIITALELACDKDHAEFVAFLAQFLRPQILCVNNTIAFGNRIFNQLVTMVYESIAAESMGDAHHYTINIFNGLICEVKFASYGGDAFSREIIGTYFSPVYIFSRLLKKAHTMEMISLLFSLSNLVMSIDSAGRAYCINQAMDGRCRKIRNYLLALFLNGLDCSWGEVDASLRAARVHVHSDLGRMIDDAKNFAQINQMASLPATETSVGPFCELDYSIIYPTKLPFPMSTVKK